MRARSSRDSEGDALGLRVQLLLRRRAGAREGSTATHCFPSLGNPERGLVKTSVPTLAR
jgi:hypothetical protein